MEDYCKILSVFKQEIVITYYLICYTLMLKSTILIELFVCCLEKYEQISNIDYGFFTS